MNGLDVEVEDTGSAFQVLPDWVAVIVAWGLASGLYMFLELLKAVSP